MFGQKTSEHFTRKWTDEFAEKVYQFGTQEKSMPAEMMREDGTGMLCT